MSIQRIRYIFLGSILLLFSLLLSCGSDGNGISNYDFASTNSPGILSINFSFSGSSAPTAGKPISLIIITNISSGYPYTGASNIHASYTFTAATTNLILTNITFSPVYILACHETETFNTNVDANEPFLANSSVYNLSNMSAINIYGSRTNNVTLALTEKYRYQRGTIVLNLSYTGTNEINATTNILVGVFTGTNFTTAVTNILFTTSSTNFSISGITNTNAYLAALVDIDTSSGYSAGDPLEIYNNTSTKNAAVPISFAKDVTAVQTITLSFGDTWTNW